MAVVLCCWVAGCAQPHFEDPAQVAYEARVAELSAAFDALSPDDQKAVREKRIGKGMHKDVVTLAWGIPKTVSQSMQNGELYETWSYAAYNPRKLHNHGMPAMQGPGYYNPALSVEYGLRSAAVVNLRNDRVVDWKQWEDDQPQAEPASVAATQFDIEEPAAPREPAEKRAPAVEEEPEFVAEDTSQDSADDGESGWEGEGEFDPIGDEGEEIEVEIPPVEAAGLLGP